MFAQEIIEANKWLSNAPYRYFPDAHDKFIYLVRMESDGSFQRLGRLTYERALKGLLMAYP